MNEINKIKWRNDDKKTIQQLQDVNTQLVRKLGEKPSIHAFPRRLCQLGAILKQRKDTPDTLADDCFTAAMEFVSMSRLAKHCQESERDAHYELQKIAGILDTTVKDLPCEAERLSHTTQVRDFLIDRVLFMDKRTRNMIQKARNTYYCSTLDLVACLSDKQFFSLPGCGPSLLAKIRLALSMESVDSVNNEGAYEDI